MRVFVTIEVARVAPMGRPPARRRAPGAWVFATGHRPGGCLDPKLKRTG
jgi:hypothetical protein